MCAGSTGLLAVLIWGAHAPRHRGLCSVMKTDVSAMAPNPAREARALPRRSLADPGQNVPHLEPAGFLRILSCPQSVSLALSNEETCRNSRAVPRSFPFCLLARRATTH